MTTARIFLGSTFYNIFQKSLETPYRNLKEGEGERKAAHKLFSGQLPTAFGFLRGDTRGSSELRAVAAESLQNCAR